jgi:benzylsuccinate CoA-transferase BbsE subunit
MKRSNNNKDLLGSFRVLDLADEKGSFAGKILGDLGADVIKIEKPGGDESRNIGPFYHNIPDPEKSLFWFAYNLNKRGITLNIETRDGQQMFKDLVSRADFVIESFSPGFIDSLGLGYRDLSNINPRVVMTSITPFGQTGPYSNFRASDIVAEAMGGFIYITGSPDGPPVRISFPQAYQLAGAYAAAATMIAHYYREMTGEGQHVDVSMQACIALALSNAIPLWELNRNVLKRSGAFLVGRGVLVKSRILWQCKDGYIVFHLMGGVLGGKGNRVIAKWMEEDGMMTEFLQKMNWEFDVSKQTQDIQDQIEMEFARYFAKHTKTELYKKAQESGIMLCPLNSVKDVVESPQLQARDYWVEVEHPELGTTLRYPGAFIKGSLTPCRIRRRAPLIGEHNKEIYENELGLSRDSICILKEAGII